MSLIPTTDPEDRLLASTDAVPADHVAHTPPRFPDWSPFGAVIPVLAGSSGAGASVFAAAVVDELQRANRCALLIDADPGPGSGLSLAAREEGPVRAEPIPGARIRYSWRRDALVARLDGDSAEPATRMRPPQWLPQGGLEPLHVSVVDLGRQWSSVGDDPDRGASAWLRAAPEGHLQPWPVLVVRPTRPSLMAAEVALSRLDELVRAELLMAPVQLVVMASWKRRGWPPGVVGTAGARVSRLLDDAVFLRYDSDLELSGVTDEPLPRRVREPVAALLDDWGLLAPPQRFIPGTEVAQPTRSPVIDPIR